MKEFATNSYADLLSKYLDQLAKFSIDKHMVKIFIKIFSYAR